MITLRPAESTDEERLLEWRNDPTTRATAFSDGEVGVEDHRRWFADKLADEDCVQWIVERDGEPLGQVRLDRVSDGVAEVDISVASEHRGQGVGVAALGLVAEQAPQLLGVTALVARVKTDNELSLKMFRSAGFEVVRGGDPVELRLGID